MCLIAYSPHGAMIERRVFDYARTLNSDGIGVMSAAGIEKFVGRKAGKRAWRYLRTLAQSNVPYGLHFRWATHGDVTRANCHPFIAPDSDAIVMHNGVIRQTAKHATKDKSDTALFVERFMRATPAPHEPAHESFFRRAAKFLGWDNKLLVYHANANKFTICNEDQGEWIDGMWYSNDYSLPDDVLPYRKPVSWTSQVQEMGKYGTLAAYLSRGPGDEYADRNVSDAVTRGAPRTGRDPISGETAATDAYYASLELEDGYLDDGAELGTRAAERAAARSKLDHALADADEINALREESALRDYLQDFRLANYTN